MVKEVHLGLIFNHQPSQAHHLCFLQDITQSSQNPGNSSRRKKYSSRYFRKSKTQLILPEPTRTLKSQTPSALQVGKFIVPPEMFTMGKPPQFPSLCFEPSPVCSIYAVHSIMCLELGWEHPLLTPQMHQLNYYTLGFWGEVSLFLSLKYSTMGQNYFCLQWQRNAPDCLGEINFRIVARLRKLVAEILHSWIMRLWLLWIILLSYAPGTLGVGDTFLPPLHFWMGNIIQAHKHNIYFKK